MTFFDLRISHVGIIRVNLAEAKKHFSRYTRLVKGGSFVVLCERNKPIAEIRPIGHLSAKRTKRKIGLMRGLCPIGVDFLKEDLETGEDFYKASIFPDIAPKS